MPDTPLYPALATFNRESGAMWLTYADGTTTLVADDVRDHRAASAVLDRLGAVQLGDWCLVASKAPMRRALIEVPA